MEILRNHNQAEFLRVKDNIDELLLKAQSITSCLLAMNYNDGALCRQYWYGALWAINGYLDELENSINLLERF